MPKYLAGLADILLMRYQVWTNPKIDENPLFPKFIFKISSCKTSGPVSL